MIPFPSFEPDKALYNVGAGDTLLNVLPVADGWGPAPALATISDALGSECRGATYYVSAAGDVTVIAGTATDLYKLDTSTSPYSWLEDSKSSGVYNVPVGDFWSFTQFGDYLVAHTLGDDAQFIDVVSGTAFADLPGSPPRARYSWVAGDFLVFGYLSGEPQTVHWSGINDAEFWTIGERGCDKQALPDGGQIMGGVPSPYGATIVQRAKIRVMQSTGNAYVFSFSVANDAKGTLSPRSIASLGNNQFAYLSDQGFFIGAQAQPIGAERVDRWFFNTCEPQYLNDVRSAVDPYRKIVWWRFQTINGTARLLGYHWQLDRWCLSDQDFTAAVPLATPGLSWDALGGIYDTIDDIDVPFDSPLFNGGVPQMAAFTTGNKLAYFAGQNMAATLRTADVELTTGRRSFVNSAYVIGDLGANGTLTVAKSDFHGDSFDADSAVSPSARTARFSLRSAGRQHRFTLSIPAGTDWTTVSGIEVGMTAEGNQ